MLIRFLIGAVLVFWGIWLCYLFHEVFNGTFRELIILDWESF